MTAYIVQRLLWLPVLLLFISLITFGLGLYGPGNPIEVLAGTKATPAIIDQIKKDYGFDQPFYVQYLNYVRNALQFNFGYSLVKYRDQKVSDLIAQRLPVTIQINLISLLWSIPLGIALGILAGVWRNSVVDVIARFVVIAGISLPVILLLPFLTFAFSRQHEINFLLFSLNIGPILPVGVGGQWDGIFSTKIILPAFLEGLGPLAGFTRQTRAGMIETLRQDYIRTARAKGLRERLVVFRHALRNAFLPLVTIIGFLISGLVEGSFLVENWFGIPGVGALAFDAFVSREYYIILAFVLLAAVAFVSANLLIDLAYAFIDPRIRYT